MCYTKYVKLYSSKVNNRGALESKQINMESDLEIERKEL